jgi:hypothetical protein
MKALESFRAWRRRRRERAEQTLVAARLAERPGEPDLAEDAERLRLESRRNTPIPPIR